MNEIVIQELQIYKNNIKELQAQLAAAHKRISELTDEVRNQKMKQKSMTELNYDGNEFRGRYGEDESV